MHAKGCKYVIFSLRLFDKVMAKIIHVYLLKKYKYEKIHPQKHVIYHVILYIGWIFDYLTLAL